MFCPKCRSTKVEDQEFIKLPGEGTARHCAEIRLDVHPFEVVYGIPPGDKFFGIRWTCGKCGYSFFARKEMGENEHLD